MVNEAGVEAPRRCRLTSEPTTLKGTDRIAIPLSFDATEIVRQ